MATELLVVTVELGENQKDTITIREGDSLRDLAHTFSLKHNLNPFVQASIEAYLEQNLATLKSKTAMDTWKPRRKKVHPCVRLYKSGISQLKKKEQQRQRHHELKVQSELEQMSFKPTINRAPSMTARSTRREKPPLEEWTNDQCSFHPLLCEKSRRMASTRKNVLAKPVENSKPQSTRSTRKINLNESVERLTRVPKRKAQQPQLLRNAFTPKTGRYPVQKRPSDVFTHLYKSRSRSVSRSPEHSTQISANSKSSKLVEQMKANRFQSLFESFSPEQGLISYETIMKHPQNPGVLAHLKPILQELKDSGEQLSFEEFCGAVDALYTQLSPEEKYQFLFKMKSVEEQPSSKKMSELYHRLLTYRQNIDHQIQMVEEFDPTLKQFNRLT